MSKPVIQVLVGMIASGKSTYARNAARRGFLVVSEDEIVKLVHGQDYKLYDDALKPIYKTIENQIVGSAIIRYEGFRVIHYMSVEDVLEGRVIE